MFSPDQRILVTGASSGIGRAIALECVARGATVLACGRNGSRLEEGGAACADSGRWISIIRDFTDEPEAVPKWMRQLAGEYGKLAGLAHAAGTAVMDTLGTYDPAQASKFFDFNFSLSILLARGFSDRRVAAKDGAMVFLASTSGIYPEKGHLLYGAIKSALACAAKSIAAELAPRCIRVNCVAPGIVDTPMEAMAEEFMGPSYRQNQLAAYPLGFGRPEDVARMAVFLLSTDARWITGQNFVLDGGRY